MDKLPVARIESDEAKELADLVSLSQDLTFVVDATERLAKLMHDNSEDQVLIRSLWSAALVAYVRCFTSGKRFGMNKDIFSAAEGGEVTHQYFKDTRDRHIAHSVNPFEEVQIGLVLSEQADKPVLGVAKLSAFRLTDDLHNVEQLGRLAGYARQIIERQGKEIEEKVLAQGRSLSKAKLEKLPRIRIQPSGGTATARSPRSK